MFIGAPRTKVRLPPALRSRRRPARAQRRRAAAQRLNDDELEAWEEDYEDHLLREPFSVLYAMNHQVFHPLIQHTADHIKRVIRE
jgi:hypothetical protein